MKPLAETWPEQEHTIQNGDSFGLHKRAERMAPPPTVHSLIEIAERAPDPEQILLGNRYLCRGGGLLIVAPSGVGKSSMSIQQDILWALGKPAFGIVPARPLKTLIIQAENDNGDVSEMANGVISGLCINEADRQKLSDRVHIAHETSRTGARFFVEVLRPLVAQFRPDLVRLDPLLAYLGGDPIENQVISSFCRNGLNPILEEFACGAVIVHHTPKTTNRQTKDWRPSDWSYSGAGAAELTNWARAVIAIEPTGESTAFRFLAAKRGQRIGWKDEVTGQPTLERFFQWADGSIFWNGIDDPSSVPNLRKRKNTKTHEDLLKVFPPTSEEIHKEKLLEMAANHGIGLNKARGFLSILLEEGKMREIRKPRSGARPAIYIARGFQSAL